MEIRTMPKYRVRVIYEYPVQAVSPHDALDTVPIATRLKYINADGTAEVINSEGKVVLKAKRVDKRGTACFKEELQDDKANSGQAALVA